MAARKETNRYYPPEFWDDPKFGDKSNLNSFRGEGWRNRGAQVNSKLLTQGRNVIRFEMPFDIWCGGCNEVIHKGVRFNSDKNKVGPSSPPSLETLLCFAFEPVACLSAGPPPQLRCRCCCIAVIMLSADSSAGTSIRRSGEGAVCT